MAWATLSEIAGISGSAATFWGTLKEETRLIEEFIVTRD